MINRRGFFATLFAPLVAKALPAPKPQTIEISMAAGKMTATPGSTTWIYTDTGCRGWIIYHCYVTVTAAPNMAISIGAAPQG